MYDEGTVNGEGHDATDPSTSRPPIFAGFSEARRVQSSGEIASNLSFPFVTIFDCELN